MSSENRCSECGQVIPDESPGGFCAQCLLQLGLSGERNGQRGHQEPGAAESPWWQSNTVVDAAGGAHTTFFTDQSIYYAYCPAGCGDPGNWQQTAVTGADIFAARSPAGNGAYGGMYVDTAGSSALPFYGYSQAGSAKAWTYLPTLTK